MARLRMAGRRGRYPIAGGWVADRTYTVNLPGVGDYVNPRKLFIPADSQPGVSKPTLVYWDGAPRFRGTNATPSVMNNTTQISGGMPTTEVIPNAATFPDNVYCQQHPGHDGSGNEWPNGPIGRRSFLPMLHADILAYNMDRNRIIGIGHSGGGSLLYQYMWKHPEIWAGCIFLDQFTVQSHLVDAAHEGMNPDGQELATAANIPDNEAAWASYASRCGHIPIMVVRSASNFSLFDPHYQGFFNAYTAAGKTWTSYTSAWPTHPTIDPTAKYVYVRYTGATHGDVGQDVTALSNTTFWGWIDRRRRGE